ncbi:hypothetical protein [Methanoregula sp.]|uniref:hypothetical protein n=1 Tax=Methanoregula sp. TaxID=2052170 RepID=UPI003563BAC4
MDRESLRQVLLKILMFAKENLEKYRIWKNGTFHHLSKTDPLHAARGCPAGQKCVREYLDVG